ncbi:MAG TPA: helix-turn-helix transcriptional regulator [Verrucomicrobiae bacterium]|nr:helix-turn-helix transcriptional regulator [Verrucomicrobiae bacterium]
MKRNRSESDDVFEQLGFSPIEAANLRLRSVMMDAVIEEIERRSLTQAKAAKIMGITQPRVSNLMAGKLHLFSVDTLIALLAKLGLRVEMKVRKAA